MLDKLSSSGDFVEIFEMGPRDGLQNEKQIIATSDKFEFIKLLALSNLQNIEVTSFVKPSAIPQMSDSLELSQLVYNHNLGNINLPCLVPNLKGLENAKKFGLKEVAVFSATSNEFNKRNINTDVKGSFERLAPVIKEAKDSGIRVRAYISTAFGCPYEGDISEKQLLDVVEKFLKLEVDSMSIGDTTGVATPVQVDNISARLIDLVGADKLAMHFHDTRGMALTNILMSLEHGVRIFDSSAGGIGGCPYAKGATGNVATEDVIYLCNSLGLKTGVDFEKLTQASLFMLDKIGRKTESKYLRAYLNTQK